MTDARFPEQWLNDKRIIKLSDGAFRTFVLSLAWAASNRTDGYVERDDLRLIHGADPSATAELERAGLWAPADDLGLMVVDFHKTQTTRAQLEGLDHKRHQDRERKAKQRRRERGEMEPGEDMSRVTSGVTSDVTQRTGQEGQDRTGALKKEEVKEEVTVVEQAPLSSSSEPCFSCGVRPAVNGSDCLACSSGGSDLQHHSVSEPTAPNGGATVAHRAPAVHTSCPDHGFGLIPSRCGICQQIDAAKHAA